MFKIPKTKYPARIILRWLWRELRGNRLQSLLNAMLGVADVALSLTQVWAVKHAIDIASGSEQGSIYWAVALMGLIILANFGVSIAGVWVRNILGVRAQNRMQQRMLAHILQAEWHSRERHHSGDVLNRLEIDVTTVVTFLTETVPNTLSVILMFVGAFACMFVMDHTLAVLLVAIMPVFLAVSRIYVGKMRSLTRMVRDSDSHVPVSYTHLTLPTT